MMRNLSLSNQFKETFSNVNVLWVIEPVPSDDDKVDTRL
jgi:hypothetical protein